MSLAAVSNTESRPLHVRRIQALASSLITLLDIAERAVDSDLGAAKASIARATSLLRVEVLNQGAADDCAKPGVRLTAWQIQNLKAYIENNLDQPIRIKELSRVAKRSPSHFCHTFKRTFGETPHAYLITRRVERAGVLMLESDALLTEIAYNCGFADQAHLSKLFRQRTGQSPSVWRRERRGAVAAPPDRLAGEESVVSYRDFSAVDVAAKTGCAKIAAYTKEQDYPKTQHRSPIVRPVLRLT